MGNDYIFTISDRKYKIDRMLLGNKGANLVDMRRLGIPVPNGVILSSKIWEDYKKDNDTINPTTWKKILEEVKSLSDNNLPPLLSVRSGSTFSMPGMMDTILNIGLSKANLQDYSKKYGEKTTYDGYRRLLEMFAIDVFDIDENAIYNELENFLKEKGVISPSSLQTNQIKELISKWEKVIQDKGYAMPQDPVEQLEMAVLTVLKSWDNPGAVEYRRMYGIPENAGTGVVIQKMVFGNMDENSSTGVYFTRNPITGEDKPFGEILHNAQGEDVVSGHFHPIKLQDIDEKSDSSYQKLFEIGRKLEKHYHQPQDIEFTIESGDLYILQTRSAKLTAKAAFKIAHDMYENSEINQGEAVRMISPSHVHELISSQLSMSEEDLKGIESVQGIAASNGVASGRVVFSKKALDNYSNKGSQCILIDDHIDPNDVETLFKSTGVVTTKGGSASHMAIIMRAAGVPGIVGCQGLEIDFNKAIVRSHGKEYKEGDIVTIDGGTGKIYFEELEVVKSEKLEAHEKEMLKLRAQRLGKSDWSAACYKTEKQYQRSSWLEKIQDIVPTLKWKSTKARTVQILNELIPDDSMIVSKVFTPSDVKGIKDELKNVIESGAENSPRTTHYPERLSGAPWAFGPNETGKIDQFISGEWEGKYKGFKGWQDEDLESVIISREPADKMNSELARDHFAFTVSLVAGSPYRLVISVSVGSPHLRQFERSVQQDTIEIAVGINKDGENNLGAIKLKVGMDMLLSNSKELFREFSGYELNHLDQYLRKDAKIAIEAIMEKVLKEWWRAPFSLPHLMCALDDELSLSVLEGQGRIKDDKVLWSLVYGAKGSEEQELVREKTLD